MSRNEEVVRLHLAQGIIDRYYGSMFKRATLLFLVVIGSIACDHCFTTHYTEIGVSGLPRCAPGAMLNRPIMIELTSGDSRIKRYFSGTGMTESISIPEGERDWRVRFGLCRERTDPLKSHYQCNTVDWFGEQSVTLDTNRTGTTLPVPTPPESSCWAGPQASQ